MQAARGHCHRAPDRPVDWTADSVIDSAYLQCTGAPNYKQGRPVSCNKNDPTEATVNVNSKPEVRRLASETVSGDELLVDRNAECPMMVMSSMVQQTCVLFYRQSHSSFPCCPSPKAAFHPPARATFPETRVHQALLSHSKSTTAIPTGVS